MSRRNCLSVAQTWGWIGLDEVMAAALLAVFEARKAVRNPAGEPWLCEGVGWNDREAFGNELVRAFAAAIDRHAAAAGLDDSWLMDGGYVLPSGCRGGAPAVMAHGCAASASAVGPAHEVPRTADITLNADSLFCASVVQELPGTGSFDNVRDNRGGNQ